MIRFDRVTITYPDAARPTLRDVNFEIPAGELCVVVGATGTGKSTLLGAINGLVPHFTGGELRGRVTVDGRDTRTHPPRELADLVGVVTQDPLAGCVTDTLEEELAYGMEQLAIPPDGDAQARRGDPRPPRPGRAPQPRAAPALGRPAATGRDRRGAHRAPEGARARRADLRARPHRRRGGARVDHPARARPRRHGRDGRAPARTRRAVRRLASCTCPATARVEYGDPARASSRARASRRRSSSSAASQAGNRCRSRCATRAGARRRWPTRSPASPRRPRCRRRRPRARSRSGRAGSSCGTARSRRCATSTSSSGPVRSSRSWAATARASRRCCGRSRAREHARADASTSRARIRPTSTRREARTLVGLVPHTPSDLLYLDTVAEELARADAESVAAAGPGPRDARSDRARRPRRRAPARSLRRAAARARARGAAHRRRPRRAPRRTDARPRLPRQARAQPACCASSRPAATRSRCRPTTWSSSPRPRTGSW